MLNFWYMSSSQATVDFILDQISSVGDIRVRKMFGDYALYCDNKVVGLICNDELFIKYTDSGKRIAAGKYVEGRAYPGAKPSMNVSESLDDKEFITTLVRVTADSLPQPKVKTK